MIDKPIPDRKQESLGLSGHADALREFIESCDTPLTIGIQGDWGIGKTSFLNLISEHLGPARGKRNQYPTIYVNTWQYAQFDNEEYLGIAVLSGIISMLQQRFPDENDFSPLQKGIAKVWKIARNVSNQALRSHTGVDLGQAINDNAGDDGRLNLTETIAMLESFKTQFRDIVDKIIPSDGRSKIVIMIDDLDRVKPIRAIQLLDSMKIFLDVEKCVFVIAVDYSVIQQGVRDKLGSEAQVIHGKSYFDKIIQVPFNMPTSAYQMDAYIMSLLGWKQEGDNFAKADGSEDRFLYLGRTSSIPKKEAAFFSNIIKLTVGANPRGIKRVINYVNLLKRVASKNIQRQAYEGWTINELKILFALGCLQLQWPELFMIFAENPTPTTIKLFEDWNYLSSQADLKILFVRAANAEQVKSNITGYFDELISVIDTNNDGEISIAELEPVLAIMKAANLTSVELVDLQNSLNEIRERAMTAATERVEWHNVIPKFFASFKKSEWNSRLRVRLVEAGSRFHNILLDGQQVGSLVTTKSLPLQMYLKTPLAHIDIDDDCNDLITTINEGHYGIGDTWFKIWPIASLSDDKIVAFMNRLHSATVQWLKNS